MHTLYALFGAPEDVAARHTLRSAAHALLAAWLRVGEALMRRLLLVEASAYPRPNTRPLLHPHRKRTRKLMGFDADAPEKWRVSFKCFSKDCGHPARSLPAGSRQSQRFHSAWPLAERYEALLRVFNDPAPFARRLAARLHATAHRLRAMLRLPADASQKIDGLSALAEAVDDASRHFSSS